MTEQRRRANSGFGPDVIQLIIPHRRPFLLVDRVTSWALEPRSTLEGQKHITVNEPVFEGHFPGWSLWPGVYTLEGLGQASMLLAVLRHMVEDAGERGMSPDEVVRALRNLDAGFHLRPGFAPDRAKALRAALGPPSSRVGMASDVDVKLLSPVFAGQRLDYSVELTRSVGRVQRFEVEAAVDGVPVARGTLGSVAEAFEPPRGKER